MRCLLQADESEVESNSGCDEAPARCVFEVASTRQPVCGSDSVLSHCQVVFDVAAALQWRVLHSGGLRGTIRFVPLVSSIVMGLGLDGDSMVGKGCYLRRRLSFVSASVALRSGLIRVDVPIRSNCVVSCRQVVWLVSITQYDQTELSCVRRMLMPQSNPSVFVPCFFPLVIASQGYNLIFFCCINGTYSLKVPIIKSAITYHSLKVPIKIVYSQSTHTHAHII